MTQLRTGRFRLVLLLVAWLAAPAPAGAQAGSGLLVFGSDFGSQDGAVASMKGVALGIDRRLGLYDLTHDIPPFDIWAGAYQLALTTPYWPPGTVFVMVVDPGVGTDRPAVVLRTLADHYVVAPDNGLLTLVAEREGIGELRWLDTELHRLPGSEASHTFHGRDVFAVVGAKLASGEIGLDAVGPVLEPKVVMLDYERPKLQDSQVVGMIPALDGSFGNVWTNIDSELFEQLGIAKGETVRVRIQEEEALLFDDTMPFVDTFGNVPPGEPLLYVNSAGAMAVAINLGNFAGWHGIGYGPGWRIELARP